MATSQSSIAFINRFPKRKDKLDLDRIEEMFAAIDPKLKSMLRIDFSVVNDIKYYNGIVFKGFIDGVPTGILSGGQYDKLMKKMGKSDKAIGFAVYLDEIEKLSNKCKLLEKEIDALKKGNASARAN